MRVLLWHGWILEGSGSNVYTARVAEILRRAGHDVLLVCQEPHPERFGFIDAWASADETGVSRPVPTGAPLAVGTATLIRPDIGSLLPVFVYDEYEGFEVKRFVDLSNSELDAYLARNVEALRAITRWRSPDAVVAGHALPGPVVARRALGGGSYIAKVHGSDLEYAVTVQRRYGDLAREGLEGALAVTGATGSVLARTVVVVPAIAERIQVISPGVEVEQFHPAPRREALLRVAELLEADVERMRGRPEILDREVRVAVDRRDLGALDGLAGRYDQAVPDPLSPARLRSLAGYEGPLVGYFGKLIPQKGVEHLLASVASVASVASGASVARATRTLIVGFGRHRERLAALAMALRDGDSAAARWLFESAGVTSEDAGGTRANDSGVLDILFTGRLDHRYAPFVLAALDVLVVPSIRSEAFGMVVAEGAAAGALPLVARHSGLAEVAAALEEAAGRPGLFSYEPGPGSVGRLAEGLGRLLSLSSDERRGLAATVSSFVAAEWTWERTAEQLLEAAGSTRA